MRDTFNKFSYLKNIEYINKEKYVFFIFLILSIVLYIPAFYSRWVFDAADFLLKYEKYGVDGIWYSFHESTNTFLISNHFIHFLIYKLFGKNLLYHSLFSMFWHSFNALLLLKFSKIIFRNKSIFFHLLVSLLYLTSPYHSETNIWGCNYHYLALNSCLLLLFLLIEFYNHSSSKKILFLLLFVFAFSLGLHELAFLNILILIVYQVLFLHKEAKKTWLPFIIFIPIIFIFLFLRNKIGGNTIGHYGASVHLNYNLIESIQKLFKYFYKLFFISSIHPFQFLVHKVIDKLVGYNFLILAVLVFVYFKYFYNKITFFLIFGFILFLIPVLNLYFVDYMYIAGDRYCTVPLIFSSLIIAYLIFFIFKNSKLKLLILGIIIILQAGTLFYYNYLWSKSYSLMKLIENYKFEENINYYWLNLPESYQGAYMYKGGDGENPFLVRLKLKNKDRNLKFSTIAGMNMNSIQDKVIVEKLNSDSIKVTLGQWGNWFWVGENGANDYKNEIYSVDFDDINHSYILKLNSDLNLNNNRLIFYDSGQIKQIKL
jgi:hypothetical protein